MRLDHVAYAAEPDGLRSTAARLGAALGVVPIDGGVHPRFGTRNVILPLAEGRYVEVVEVLDHPSSDKAPFGQAVRARSETGGGWLCWVVAVDDLAPFERQLGYDAPPGNRRRPDGVELRWHQIGVKGLVTDPQLPYVLRWDTPAALHPSVGGRPDVRIAGLQIAGDPDRVRTWLGLDPEYTPTSVEFTFVAPHGTPGLLAVSFETSAGVVQI
ncbi:VOC family protein [Pengzhenrongella sicca]|uniref:VOC family protein n=1 Tax=Pengzhenrongella sicca TaxID=2819238 RepID=A0A8A4ZAF0_9MICO|nr:VOC family protein [Pengzhenrongella sicca]QTE28834.1 VOC family protein [Pengzhenrongella sicca]